MKAPITKLQAMSHPTVVATINCLSEMIQRLQDENDKLKEALAQPEERNFCPRCGKRLGLGGIHTCTPPQDKKK